MATGFFGYLRLIFVFTGLIISGWANAQCPPVITPQPGQGVTITSAGAVKICAGDSVILVASPNADPPYQWYKGGILIPDSSRNKLVVKIAGNYRVKSASCGTWSDITPVTVNPLPTAYITSVPTPPVCSGDPIALTINTNANQFVWLPPVPPINAYDETINLILSGSTTIQAVAVISSTGCSKTASFPIQVDFPIYGGTIADNQTICAGVAPAPITETSAPSGGNGTYNYTWQKSTEANWYGFSTISGAHDPDYSPPALTQTTWYRRIIESPPCAGGISNVVEITVNPVPVITSPALVRLCTGQPVDYAPESSVEGTTFSWTSAVTSGTVNGVTPAGTGNINDVLSLNAGATSNATVTYTVTPTGPAATYCVGTPVDVTVVVGPLPEITNGTSTQTICSGGTTSAVAFTSNLTGTTYNWTTPALTGVSGINLSGSGNLPAMTILSTLPDAVDVVYTVTPTSAAPNNCSGTPFLYTITVNPSPTVVNDPMEQFVCSGETSAEVVLLANVSGTTFSWTATPSSSSISGFAANGTATIPAQTLTNSSSTPGYVTYAITPNAASGSCPAASRDYVIHVDPVPVMTSAANADVCSGSFFSYTIQSDVAGASFSWDRPLVTGVSNSAGNGVSPFIEETLFNVTTSSKTVPYNITITGPGTAACQSNAVVMNLTLHPLPTVDAGTDQTINYGTSTTLHGTASGETLPLNYLWSGGLASGANTPDPTTNILNNNTEFAFQVTDGANCTQTDFVWVYVTGTALALLPTASPAVICEGGATQLSANATGGSGAYNYTWTPATGLNSTTLATPTASPSVTTTYTVEVNDGFTTMSQTVTVTVIPTPTLFNLSGGGHYCTGAGGVAITLDGSTPGVNYTLALNGSELPSSVQPGTGASISWPSVTDAGNYTVVAHAGDCQATMAGTASVTVDPLPIIYTITGGGTYPSGGFGVPVGLSSSQINMHYNLERVGYGIVAPSPVAGTGGAISFGLQTGEGSYRVLAVDQSLPTACQATMAGTVTIATNPNPTVFDVVGGGVFCAGTTGAVIGLTGSEVGVTYELRHEGITTGITLPGDGNPLGFPAQTTTGQYTVWGYNTASGIWLQMYGIAVVTQNPQPVAYSLIPSGQQCPGTELFINGSQTGVDYTLLYNGFPISTISGTGALAIVSLGIQMLPGDYTVEAEVVATGCTRMLVGTTTITTQPDQFTVIPAGIVCQDQEIWLDGSQVGINYQLVRDNAFNVGSPMAGTGAMLNFGSPVFPGVYTVRATNPTTLCSRLMLESATLYPIPTVYSIAPIGDTCAPVEIELGGSDVGFDYELQLDGQYPPEITLPGTGSPLNFGLQNLSGTYTIRAVSLASLCNTSMASAVTLLPRPQVFNLLTTGVVCEGTEVVLDNSQSGVSYELILNNAIVVGSAVAGTGAAISFGPQYTPGTYSVLAHNLTSLCSEYMNGTVELVPLPVVFNITPNGNHCPGQELGLSGSQPGILYQLIRNNQLSTPTAEVVGTGSPISFGIQTLQGVYHVVAVNTVANCTRPMMGTVTLYAAPVVFELLPAGTVCEPAQISQNGSEVGMSYELLRNGVPLSPQLVLSGTGSSLDFGMQNAGNYTVMATSSYSCNEMMTGTVEVMPRPVVNAGTDVTVCTGYPYTLNPSVSNSSAIQWTTSGDGIFDDATLLNASYTPGPGDLASLGVMLTLEAYGTAYCPTISVFDQMLITYNPMPLADAGPDQQVCTGDVATLSGSVQFADSMRWTTSGTGVFSNPVATTTLYTPSLSDMLSGSVTLSLTAWGNQACSGESDADQMVLSIQPLPSVDAGASQAICANGQAVVTASSSNSATVLWTSRGDGTFVDAASFTATYQPGATDVLLGEVYLVATVSGTGACGAATATDSLLLTINPMPVANAGTDLATCHLDPVTLNGSALHYSAVHWSGGSGTFGNPADLHSLYTPSATDAAAGSVNLMLTVTGSLQCAAVQVSDVVNLAINPLPVANAGPDGVACAVGQYSLTGAASDFTSVAWTTNGSGSFSDPANLNTTYTPGASDSLAGTVVLTLTATGDLECGYATHSDQLTLTIAPLPYVEAGNNLNLCAGETAPVNATTYHSTAIQWITRGDGTFVNPTLTATQYIPGPADNLAGDVWLIALASGDGVCATLDAADSLQLFLHPAPSAEAGSDATICASASHQLNGLATHHCQLLWTTSGDGAFSNPAILNPIYTPGSLDVANGSVTLTLTATGCSACGLVTSDDNLVLSIQPLPVALAGADATICADAEYTLSGTAANQSLIVWTTTGDGLFSNPNALDAVYTPGTGDKMNGEASLILTAWGSGTCALQSDADTLLLTIDPLPLAVAGSDQFVCASSQSVLLSGVASNQTTISWITRGSGYFSNPSIASPTYFISDADTAARSFYLVMSATGSGACGSRLVVDSLLLTLQPLPVAMAGADDSVCSGEQFLCAGSAFNQQGTTWFTSGDGYFNNPHSLSALYTPGNLDRQTGNVMLWLKATGIAPCGAQTDYDTLNLTIHPLPTSVISGNEIICSGDQATLTVILTGQPPWSITYSDGLQNYVVDDIMVSPYYITVAPSITSGYFISSLNDAHCTGTAMSGTAVITVNPLPQSFTLFAESGGSFCYGGDGVELRLSGSQTGVMYQLRWGNQAYGSPVAGTGNPLTFGNVVQPGQYTVLAQSTSTGCQALMAGVATVTVHPLPDIDFDADTACLSSPVPLAVSGSSVQGIVTWMWDFGDGNTTLMYSPDDPQHVFASPGEYIISLTATDTNGCQTIVSHPARVLEPAVAWFWWSSPTCLGSAVNFQNLSYATDNEYITTWTWQFGDGTDTTVHWPDNPSVSHVYSLPGNYDVVLTITTSHGCNASVIRQVSVLPQPVADFTFTGTCQNNAAQFTDLSQSNGSGNIVQWNWNFGDPASGPSNVSSLQNPEHIYMLTGDYTVLLEVFSGNGCSDTITKTVTIGAAPTASFTADTACLGTVTQFADESVASSGAIVSWLWDFGDGATSNNQNPQHLFITPGLHTVTLTVGDADGCEATVSNQVLVSGLPVAAFTASTANCAGAAVAFNDLSTTQTGTLATWIWHFGDGTGDTVDFPENPDVEHVYNNAGSFLVTLDVITSNGCFNTISQVVTVSSSPSANFSYPSDNCPGLAVLFTDQSQLNGGTPLMSWQWDFGDPASGSLNGSTLQNPFHQYDAAGNYDVTLVVTSISTCTDTLVKTITVNPAPVASFTATGVCQGEATVFTDQSNAQGGTLAQWIWNFGDGHTSTLQNPTHTYATWGAYQVNLIVTTTAGCMHDTTLEVFVSPVPVAAFEYNGVCVNDSVHFTDLSTTPDGAITGWNWDFGDGGTSTIQHPAHQYGNYGTYQVVLEAVNSYGCSQVTPAAITIFKNPTANFDYTSHFCPAGQVEFQDVSVGNGTVIASRFWDLGNGYTTTMANPVVSYTIPDSCYNVMLVVANTHGCTDTVVQSVCVMPPMSFAIEADPACYGVPVPFRSVNLTPGDSLYFVKWNFGDPGSGPGNTSTLRNPVHAFSAPGHYLVKLKAWNSDNCLDSVYYEIDVNELPVAAFSWNEEPHCDSVVTFFPDYQGLAPVIDSVVWQFGDGSQLVHHQPLPSSFNHHFPARGDYPVSFEIFTWYGCHSDTTRQVPVKCILVDFEVVDTVVCQHQAITLNDLSVPAGLINQWEWRFGDGNSTLYSVFSPSITHTYDTTGYFRITLITRTQVGSEQVIDSTWKVVRVRAKPRARFVVEGHCVGSQIRFTDISTIHQGVIVDRQWHFGDGVTDSVTPAYHTFMPPETDYEVRLIETSDQGCSDTATLSLVLDSQPVLMLSPLSGSYCGDPMDVVLRDTSGQPNLSWEWNTGEGEPVTTDTASLPYQFYPGFHEVAVTATSLAGCYNTDTVRYHVMDVPYASFSLSPDSVGLLSGVIDLIDHSVPAGSPIVSYYWTFGDGSDSTRQDVSHRYNDAGHYLVTLEVTDQNGCMGTVSHQAVVYPQLTFFMPTAFTPNWDKLNGVLKPVGRYITDDMFEFMVFDRWGKLIFESFDPEVGWDGTVNGEPVASGVYTWMVQVRDETGRPLVKKGTVLLFR